MKKCPMRKMRYKGEGEIKYAVFEDCIGSRCAWWDEISGNGVVTLGLGILLIIGGLSMHLDDILFYNQEKEM